MNDLPSNVSRNGNVKVAVRLRPLNDDEKKEDESNRVVKMTESATTVQTGDKAQPNKEFHFNAQYQPPLNPVVGHPESQEETIMNDIGKPICRDAFRGYNGCVIAYGQTGSGKTHTMMGTPTAPGLLPRCLQEIFDHMTGVDGSGDTGVHVWISCVELYGEKLRDLLVAGPEMKDMRVVDHPMLGPIVPRRIESPCDSFESAMELLDYANKKRVLGCTTMNTSPKQSHAIFSIRIVTKAKQEDQTKKGNVQLQGEKVRSLRESITMAPIPRKDKEVGGKHSQEGSKHAVTARINFVDLAGSERIHKDGPSGTFLSARHSENFSLQVLHLVVEQFKSDKSKLQIQDNSSKLTHLLRDALGGNCHTYMIANISPMLSHREKTLTTLGFAENMMRITSVAKVNMHNKIDLRDEMNRLTAQISEPPETALCCVPQDDPTSVLEEYEYLEKWMKKSYKERLAEEEVLKADRKRYLEEWGISAETIETLHAEQATYLTNVSTDPAFTGCLVYCLKDGSSTTVGNTTDSDIVFRGLGMRNFMCTIKRDSQETMLCMNKPRPEERDVSPKDHLQIRVNGELCKSEENVLKNMDIIYFGQAMALRLCLPSEQRHPPTRAQIHQNHLTACFSKYDSPAYLESHMCPASFRSLALSAEDTEALTAKTLEMVLLLNEGNDIAWEMRSADNRVKMELEVLLDYQWDVPEDVIAIRVTQPVASAPLASGSPPPPPSLTVWSVSKFLERLELMRQKYDEFMHRQYETNQANAETPCLEGICRCTMMDPWLEPTVAESALTQRVDGLNVVRDKYGGNFDKETLTRNASTRNRASIVGKRRDRMPNMNDHSQGNGTHGDPQNSFHDLIERGRDVVAANGYGSHIEDLRELGNAFRNLELELKKKDLTESMRKQIEEKDRQLEFYKDKVRNLEKKLAEEVVLEAVSEEAKPVLYHMTRSTRLNPPFLMAPVQMPPMLKIPILKIPVPKAPAQMASALLNIPALKIPVLKIPGLWFAPRRLLGEPSTENIRHVAPSATIAPQWSQLERQASACPVTLSSPTSVRALTARTPNMAQPPYRTQSLMVTGANSAMSRYGPRSSRQTMFYQGFETPSNLKARHRSTMQPRRLVMDA